MSSTLVSRDEPRELREDRLFLEALVVPLVAGDRGADDSTTNTSSSSSTTAGLGGSTACLTTQQNMPGYTPLPQASCITLVFVLCVTEC